MTNTSISEQSKSNINQEIVDCINQLKTVNLFSTEILDEKLEFDLLKRSQSSDQKISNTARERICKSFAKYTFREAKNKFKKIGEKVSFEDLFSEANIGIIKAINNFDLSKWGKKNELGIKIRFSSYAKWWVIESMNNYCLKNSSSINFCTTKDDEKIFYNINKAIKSLKIKKSYSELNEKEILKVANELEVKEKNIKKYINAIKVSNSEKDIDNYFLQPSLIKSKQKQDTLEKIIDLESILNKKEYLIFQKYYEGYGLEEIAEELNSNKETIRQIIISFKKKINFEKKLI